MHNSECHPRGHPRGTRWAEQAWAIVRKDLLREARSRTHINAMLFFAGTVLLILSFALGPSPDRLRTAGRQIHPAAQVLQHRLGYLLVDGVVIHDQNAGLPTRHAAGPSP